MQLETQQCNDIIIVTPDEEHLDASNATQFRNQMKPLVDENKKVVLNIENINFVDSSGLGAILSCLRQVTHEGGDLKICGMARSVRVFFELVRMHKIIDIFEEKSDALASFTSAVNA